MTTSASGTTSTRSSFSQYFASSIPPSPTPTHPQPSFLSRIWNRTQHFVYSPARHATEEAAQGLANRFSELFANNQPEITNRVRDLFTHALIRRSPEKYHLFLHHIQAFLHHPSTNDLEQIKSLSDQINEDELRSLCPTIRNEGINELTKLRELLDTEVTEQPSIGIGGAPLLEVSRTALDGLQIVEAILQTLIESNEGALIQTLSFLTQSMSDPNGPLQALRSQLNGQHGVLSECLTLFRQHLNGRAHAALRQSKGALESYQNALRHHLPAAQLPSFIQNLHEKLQLFLSRRELASQISLDHWGELERFQQGLETSLNNLNTLASSDQLLPLTHAPLSILTDAFTAQRGIIEEASDILMEGIERGVAHLENLPHRMVQSIFSPHSLQASLPSSPDAPLSQTTQSETFARATEFMNILNLNQITSQGSRFLGSILNSAGGVIYQQGVSSLATLIHYTFEKIRNHVQQTPEQQHLIRTIDPMIQRLQGAIDRSAWAELTGVLQEAFRFMQEQQVYLQGLRLPLNPVRSHVSAIPEFLQNINTHQNAIQPLSQRAPQRISEEMFSKKTHLFQLRVSSMAPAKLVLEKICGIKANNDLYAEIYSISSNLSEKDLPSIFRNRIFAKIDQYDLGIFDKILKWWAKRSYDFLVKIFSFYTNSIFERTFNFLKKEINNISDSPEPRQELFIKLIRNWLAVTSGAYNQVAQVPASQSRDFGLMMEEAIKSPERNGGMNQSQIITATAKTILDTFGHRIKWDETIDNYFNTEIPVHSPLYFLNPIAIGLNIFCSFCLKAVIFIPQWIGNQILQGGAKFAFAHTSFLQNYTENSIESLRRNTPTSYATQQLIYRQLQKILQILQQSLNDEANDTNGLHSRNTNISRIEITGLVEYLLEVLNKSHYRTQDRLSNYLQHRPPLRNRLERELEDTFVPEMMETVVMTLSLTLKSVTQKEEMEQMLYEGLCIANDSFDAQQPVSDEEFAVVERGIRELADQIIETAIFHAIGEKFDFTNEKQKRGISQFTHMLQHQTRSFTTQIQNTTNQLSQGTLSAPAIAAHITSMIEYSSGYHRDRVDALGKADGNRNFHTETKHHLNEISQQLLNHCNPLVERLNQMKTHADELLFQDKLLRSFLMCSYISHLLVEKSNDSHWKPQDITFCRTQLLSLKRHLDSLCQDQCPTIITNEIISAYRELNRALQKIEKIQKTERILRAIYPLFSQLKQEKLNLENQPHSFELKRLEREICNRLNALPSTEQKNQLNQYVLSLMLSQNNAELESISSQFFSLHFQINAHYFSEKNNMHSLFQRTTTRIQECMQQNIQNSSNQMEVNRGVLRNHQAEVFNNSEQLNQWAQTQHDLPIWNLFVFDMQWVTETVKNLAFDRAQSKVKHLFESLYQRHNYFGFINQVILLPFLEKFGPHHLKNE